MLYDRAEKKRRGYVEKDSIVRQDGSEKLVGKDWRKRKLEVWSRNSGRCEMVFVLGKDHHAWCSGFAEEPHHIIPRSKKRDDRIENLVYLSHACHSLLDGRKIGGRK